MNIINMLPWLCIWPNHQMAVQLFEGFQDGFPLPTYRGTGFLICPNLPSVRRCPDIVEQKILKEVMQGRVAGPFDSPPFFNFRVSSLGIISKKEQNYFRMLYHLSYPKGFS